MERLVLLVYVFETMYADITSVLVCLALRVLESSSITILSIRVGHHTLSRLLLSLIFGVMSVKTQ